MQLSPLAMPGATAQVGGISRPHNEGRSGGPTTEGGMRGRPSYVGFFTVTMPPIRSTIYGVLMAVVIRCPACRTKFRWLAETEAYPSDCPQCGAYVGHDRADDDVVMPNILSFANRCSDGVYKAMEKASQERVYQAAEMAGCDASDMADLKITNLRDNMKQGEIAAMPVVNDLTRHMDAMRARNPNAHVGFGSDHNSIAMEYAAGAATGHIAQGVPGSILPRRGA